MDYGIIPVVKIKNVDSQIDGMLKRQRSDIFFISFFNLILKLKGFVNKSSSCIEKDKVI